MWTELLHSSVQQRARELVWLARHSGVQVVERRHDPKGRLIGAVGLDELFGITRSTVYRAVTRAGGPDGAALGQATSGRPSVTGVGRVAARSGRPAGPWKKEDGRMLCRSSTTPGWRY